MTHNILLVTLGRVEFLKASGALDRMADALNRLAEKEKPKFNTLNPE